jgi:hypothetical protein
MIEITPHQQGLLQRQDCREWTELVANDWFTSGYQGALEYPVADAIQHLRAVYFSCLHAGIENIEYISLLGFNVLRANVAGYDESSVRTLVNFFITYAQTEQIDYAQNWIELNFSKK